MHNNTGSPTAETFNELYPAILECFGIILLGYIAGRTHIVSPANSKGLGNYVTYFALPALVYKAMVELDFQKVNWLFWSAILISKTILFVIVYLASLVIGRRMDLGRAGIFAIFATQSNDFALGYPIISAIYSTHHPEYVSYLYLVGPISLAILNPFGFLSMEIQRNRQATHRSSNIVMFGRAMKGLLTNPIIIMVFLGICSNFLFSQKLPAIIAGFLNVLASSFSATALFFLGIGMVGKIKKSSAMFFLTPILLIGCKLIVLPLLTRQVVLVLKPGGTDANMTDSFATFGFLYSTIPTAPTVYLFASLYQQSMDVVATSMVLCTFAAAPIMFITATMSMLPIQTSEETSALLSATMVDVGCIGIACCVWILIVFILSKRTNIIPHHFTTHLVVAQFLASIGIVLCKVTVNESSWINIPKAIILLVGVFSSRCWAALIAVALCIMRCRGLCVVLRLRPLFYIYGWALPTLLVAILVAVAPPVYKNDASNVVFQYGMAQLVASIILLGFNFLLAVTALVILHRKDRFGHLSNVKMLPTNKPTSEDTDSESETDRMLRPSCEENGNQDIEDMRTVYQTCSITASCSSSQRETCRRRTNQHYLKTLQTSEGGDPYDVAASHQLSRHILLLLFLLLSMIIGFSLCVWKVTGETQNSLYLMLEFLDTVLAYCQGFFTLAVFGFDTRNVIIPFFNAIMCQCLLVFISTNKRLKRVLCRKKRTSSSDDDDMDSETSHTIQQFTQHHIESCKKDILKDVRIGVQAHHHEVFHGLDLVDWLVEVGLATDRDGAVSYSKRLLIGQIITVVDKDHDTKQYHDSGLLYKFTSDEDSTSEDFHVVT
ncbi:integral membrane protein GPR155-like isoform X1 [Asterias rubens]|uniref:integral membrane protein GPR155-like isoform X1 n=1 Tax=Asterias rubens TaxID=7604 RepID=UPI0014557B42|nr:integral membrane protein GPR155-like isoform X1 [Asterias rubens]